MQRIALARALYQEPKVIVLDEPNSNLDREGEVGLFSALAQLKEKRCTTFIISHRMDILRLVDKVLMLANGELVMFADRDAALAKLTYESNKQPK
jgi:ABC-type protease/lipase transport system fused ATPase/permease subunit